MTEKDRLIKQRDSLLETNSLELRKLADMLEKERHSHRTTRNQYETYQRSSQHVSRTANQQESRVTELETLRQQDRRKLASLESTFRDQLTERNNLLLVLWTRLSALCGSDWTHNNSLINGRALPSLEAVSTMLPGFRKNLLGAIKTIETLVVDFNSRVKDLDKRLWREYQNLDTRCEYQSKKLDRLETMTRSSIPAAADTKTAEISRLREINSTLKVELSSMRAANEVRDTAYNVASSPSPHVPTGPRDRQVSLNRSSTLTRHQSTSAVENYERQRSSAGSRTESMLSSNSGLKALDRERDAASSSAMSRDEAVFQLRLKELETKLRQEREARTLDRSSAKQLIREEREGKEKLRKEVAQRERREEKMARALEKAGLKLDALGEPGDAAQ